MRGTSGLLFCTRAGAGASTCTRCTRSRRVLGSVSSFLGLGGVGSFRRMCVVHRRAQSYRRSCFWLFCLGRRIRRHNSSGNVGLVRLLSRLVMTTATVATAIADSQPAIYLGPETTAGVVMMVVVYHGDYRVCYYSQNRAIEKVSPTRDQVPGWLPDQRKPPKSSRQSQK